MGKQVELYWSHQSPYCYFVLDRILRVERLPEVKIALRLLLPGVLRIPDVFADASELAQRYFDLDVRRTADFLGLPFRYPEPQPVEFEPGTIFRAAAEQPRIRRLCHLTLAANRAGKGLAFLDKVVRPMWDGSCRNWHEGDVLAQSIARMGLDPAQLEHEAATGAAEFDRELAENHERLIAAGHWGVPTFVFEGEPFFGQDRFDQLLWRMGLAEPDGV